VADPYRKLASILDSRMADHAGQSISGVPCELGTITAGGLMLDGFKHEIPDYLVAHWQVKLIFPSFTLIASATSPVDEQGNPLPGSTTTPLTRYDFLPREIDEVRIELKAGLEPGDRVLAIPVNGGREAVIICKVVS